jgi:hypothetical protein
MKNPIKQDIATIRAKLVDPVYIETACNAIAERVADKWVREKYSLKQIPAPEKPGRVEEKPMLIVMTNVNGDVLSDPQEMRKQDLIELNRKLCKMGSENRYVQTVDGKVSNAAIAAVKRAMVAIKKRKETGYSVNEIQKEGGTSSLIKQDNFFPGLPEPVKAQYFLYVFEKGVGVLKILDTKDDLIQTIARQSAEAICTPIEGRLMKYKMVLE